MLTERKKELLGLIIEKYVETGEPIGSQILVERAGLPVSGATVRNEMRELEEEGLLTHPHTSAGRIPTEAGYRFYVSHLMQPAALSKTTQTDLSRIQRLERERARRSKLVGKYVAEHIETAVIVRLERGSLYYTGLSYLFAQPEFRDSAHMVSMSSIFDECEERVEELYDQVEAGEATVLIGSENPLGAGCSTVANRYDHELLVAIVGPWRLPYARAVGMLQYLRGVL